MIRVGYPSVVCYTQSKDCPVEESSAVRAVLAQSGQSGSLQHTADTARAAGTQLRKRGLRSAHLR